MDQNKITKTKMFRKLLLSAFFLSGFTSFVYEVTWIRPLQLIFGSTIYAVSAMLTTLMIGFVLGSFLFRNRADNVKNPIFLFAGLQLGIGLYGFLVFSLFSLLPSLYLSLLGVPGFQFLQFGLVFMVLIIPGVLFGATWPVVNRAYVHINEIGRDVALLYSSNSWGNVFGALGAGFLLIPLLGIRQTSFAASALNILLAIVLAVYASRKRSVYV